MIGHVWMPLANGDFAVVAPDGEIITEELSKEDAEILASDLNVSNDPRVPCKCESGQPCDCF